MRLDSIRLWVKASSACGRYKGRETEKCQGVYLAGRDCLIDVQLTQLLWLNGLGDPDTRSASSKLMDPLG